MIRKLQEAKYLIGMNAIERHRTYANISNTYIKYTLSRYYKATAVVNMSKDKVYFKRREKKALPIYCYAEDLDIGEYENERGYYEDYRTIRETRPATTLRTLSNGRGDDFE